MNRHKRPPTPRTVAASAQAAASTTPASGNRSGDLTILHPHAAGIDVHSDMNMVCVPLKSVAADPPCDAGGLPRTFAASGRIPAT